MRRVAALCALSGLLAGCAIASPRAPVDPPSTGADVRWSGVVVLVRHAEAEHDPGGDPALTPAGRARAERLRVLLGAAGLGAVHTSPYARARETAAPIARQLGLEAEPYDPRRLDVLADRLRRAGGRHLVVGHSNTTPALVTLLGGEAGDPIAETEHGRIYLLTPGADGRGAHTLILVY